jgi:hypothetical protein
MRSELFARCTRCGDFVSLDPHETASCSCGALFTDSDAARFGSTLGDSRVEVYRPNDKPLVRRLDADDDIADFLPRLDVPVGLDDLV